MHVEDGEPPKTFRNITIFVAQWTWGMSVFGKIGEVIFLNHHSSFVYMCWRVCGANIRVGCLLLTTDPATYTFLTILKYTVLWVKINADTVEGTYENIHHELMLLFWVVTPCRLVGRYRRFGETYCLHTQFSTYESTRRHNWLPWEPKIPNSSWDFSLLVNR
jgi:hypothetical protein